MDLGSYMPSDDLERGFARAAHGARRGALASFLAVAVLVIVVHVVLEVLSSGRDARATAIALSHSQRATAERVARFALEVAMAPNQAAHAKARGHLQEALASFEDVHHALQSGDQARSLGGAPSAEVGRIFSEAPHLLDAQVRAFLGDAAEVAAAPVQSVKRGHAALERLLDASAGDLVKAIDALVHQLEMEGEARVQRTAIVHRMTLVLVLLALLGASVVLIQPQLRQLVERGQQLVESRRALQQGEARWRSLFETSRDGIVTTTPDGTIRGINASAMRLFCVDKADVIGRPIHTLVPDFDRVISAHPRIYVGRRADGKEVDVELLLRGTDERLAGEKLLTAFVRDVTSTSR